jgi:hypothetical protein
MPPKRSRKPPVSQEERLRALIASFSIEGIRITMEEALALLKKVQPTSENSTGLLFQKEAFIHEDQDAAQWKEILTARIARSEVDFKAGRVFTQDEVEARFKAGRTS